MLMIWSGKQLTGVCHHILVVRLTLLHMLTHLCLGQIICYDLDCVRLGR